MWADRAIFTGILLRTASTALSRMLPQFIVAGAARCGTTSLYYYLRQHPGLYLPRKETFFFARDHFARSPREGPPRFRDPAQCIREESEYDALFKKSGGRLAGEVSTCYAYLHDTAIPRLREKLGDARILFLLRHPAGRAWSGYRHFVRLGYETLSFEEALEQEAERVREGWDFMWHYAALGFYARQVAAFRAAFSRVLVIRSETFFSRPGESLRSVFDFIGADPGFAPDTRRVYNFAHEDRHALAARLLDSPAAALLVKPLARRLLSRSRRLAWRERLRRPAAGPAPRPRPETLEKLQALYAGDLAALRAAEGIVFDS
jgi:hypothetical protein